MSQRQVIIDTETTGLSPQQGHRIIEIGALELVNRRLTGKRWHCYLQPDCQISEGAMRVHGITSQFLADKPRFAEIADELLEFLHDAELVIHNAPFDMGFLDHEFNLIQKKPLSDKVKVLDTLPMARKMHPGQKNSLDALCKRYGIDNAHRQLHGALLDAEILAEVYLMMTGGQTSLSLSSLMPVHHETVSQTNAVNTTVKQQMFDILVQSASADELQDHHQYLEKIHKTQGQTPVWMLEDA